MPVVGLAVRPSKVCVGQRAPGAHTGAELSHHTVLESKTHGALAQERCGAGGGGAAGIPPLQLWLSQQQQPCAMVWLQCYGRRPELLPGGCLEGASCSAGC